MSLTYCNNCDQAILLNVSECPHCSENSQSRHGTRISTLLLLGILLPACQTETETVVPEEEPEEVLDDSTKSDLDIVEGSTLMLYGVGEVEEEEGRISTAFGDADEGRSLDEVLSDVSDGVTTANPETKPASPVEKRPSTNVRLLLDSSNQKLEKVLRRYLGQVKYCYDSRLKTEPKLEGRITFSVSIVKGKLVAVTNTANQTKDKALAVCVRKKMLRWKVPAETSETLNVSYLLNSPEKEE
jgi:hypothetical protein